jgi:hypothetical protein
LVCAAQSNISCGLSNQGFEFDSANFGIFSMYVKLPI